MIIKRIVQLSALLSIGSCLCLLAPCLLAPSAMALPSTELAAKDSKQEPNPTRQGLPGRRISGGSRSGGIFLNEADQLAAITAPTSLSVTTSAHPEMLFYLPEMKADNSAEFVLLNAEGEVVYEETLLVERASDLIRIRMANAGETFMQLDEAYEWYFSIIPEALDRSKDVVVHGSIVRVDESEWFARQQIDVQLEDADALAQAQAYRDANLWHDAILTLNDLRQAYPNDMAIASAWSQLLAAADLSSAVGRPTLISEN